MHAAVGSCALAKACEHAACADAKSEQDTTKLTEVSGAGNTFMVISSIIANVPKDPAISFDKSYPVTFFITRLPD